MENVHEIFKPLLKAISTPKLHEKCIKCVYINKDNKCWALKDNAVYGKDGCDYREDK